MNEEEIRGQLLHDIWDAQDKAYDLMTEYNSLLHVYGEEKLYQVEGNIIDVIGLYPGITATELANLLKKTTSACSQSVKKLRMRELVQQDRNSENNREYNLFLTEKGQKIKDSRAEFTKECQKATFRKLEHFSIKELQKHLEIQRMLNLAYKEDIERSR